MNRFPQPCNQQPRRKFGLRALFPWKGKYYYQEPDFKPGVLAFEPNKNGGKKGVPKEIFAYAPFGTEEEFDYDEISTMSDDESVDLDEDFGFVGMDKLAYDLIRRREKEEANEEAQRRYKRENKIEEDADAENKYEDDDDDDLDAPVTSRQKGLIDYYGEFISYLSVPDITKPNESPFLCGKF